ncbi:protein of unknown function [Methylocaldum szegediense]|uniref:Uncharacterized protein n=1 Tax=Methylocaldum szegediense TaxID=73780 RepID=A0ABN8X425_9GAMM|nr:protein of unknown function [Methylocaldum szegediense]
MLGQRVLGEREEFLRDGHARVLPVLRMEKINNRVPPKPFARRPRPHRD